MIARFVLGLVVALCCCGNALVASASASALVLQAKPQPYFGSFTCPRTLVPAIPPATVNCP